MSYKHREKYLDLRINGRLFPSWIVNNFKDYKLEDIALGDTDPCAIKATNKELRKYQKFIGKYMDFYSPYKSILIYHGLGSGKTRSAINIYNVLYNYTPGWNVFILLPATLKPKWKDELDEYLDQEDKTSRINNIKFISYNASNADKAFMTEIQNSDVSKKNIYIIDEAHNFIRNVYSNINSKQGKRAQTIYDYMIQDQQENQDTRIVLLSGTPAINNPYELALLFNLLRPNSFPKSEAQFNREFISTTTYESLNPIRKNLFQRRITGLVSYYIGSTPDYFASQRRKIINIKMSNYQEDIYNFFEAMEEKMAKKKKGKQSSETYKSYTRQACNFVFPYLGQGMSGDTRPRPRNFKISEKIGQELQKGKIEKGSDKYFSTESYMAAIDKYMRLFDESINKLVEEDEKKGFTIMDEVKIFKDKNKDDEISYEEYFEKADKISKVHEELNKCSAKMANIIFNMFLSTGPILVYSNYVLMEGLSIFKVYLKFFGYVELNNKTLENKSKNGFRFMEYHGGIDQEARKKSLDIFNKEENKHGDVCKVVLVSPAGSEGLDLKSVRQVHIMEPYWHETRIDQMVGRAIRLCSHSYLPVKDRIVDVYRYKSVREKYPKAKVTTDQYIEDMARSKQGSINSFLDAVKEASVDCNLFKAHNMLRQDYKCFQFDEPSLFDEQIGPAYKEDLVEDMKLDNGLNSINSQVIKIKVLKINAVKQLDKEGKTFSKPETYWYYPETGVVYDFELHFAIGKVAYDKDGIPKKIDKSTYIIDKLIPIPLLKDKKN